MTNSDERMQAVDQRLGRVEAGLQEVREEVGGLREEVGGLREEVGGLRGEVNGLRVVGEKNAEDIKKIAEVQVHHGQKLDALTKALEPLTQLRDLLAVIAPDHEHRITALEGHTGLRK